MADRTHLYENHVKKARMVDFAGWDMPVLFETTGTIKEHMAVRDGVGIFDASHMGDFFVRGENSAEFLNYVTSNDVNKVMDVDEEAYRIGKLSADRKFLNTLLLGYSDGS